MPSISIILPFYNAKETLEHSIESILAQDFKDFELLLIDDGSTDTSLSIARQKAEKDPRVRILQQSHQGIVTALNTGIASAQSTLIARMDADDWSHPQRLSLQKKFLDEHPDAGLVSCCVEFTGDTEKQKGYYEYVKWTNGLLRHEDIYLNRFVESPLAHPSVMFRKELTDRHGPYRDGNFPEDYELWLRWLQAGVKMQKLPDVLLKWNDSAERISRTDSRYSTEAFYQIKSRYLAAILHDKNNIWVWGAGRVTRNRIACLIKEGVTIAGYIDVDPAKLANKYDGLSVINYQSLPPPGEQFILAYVASRGARTLIRNFLINKGYKEGLNFICGA